MEKMILVPHHLLNLSVLERIAGNDILLAAQGVVDAALEEGDRYAVDVLDHPYKKDALRENVMGVMRRYRQRSDNTQVIVGKVGLDEFCYACPGKHLHCESIARVITDLPINHPLAKKIDQIDDREANRFVEGLIRRLRENPHFDPDNITNVMKRGNITVATTQLGVVKRVLQETPVAYWRTIQNESRRQARRVNKQLQAYYASVDPQSA